jgi:hypothetical protein
MIIENINTSDAMEVDSLQETERGTAGFGSTDFSIRRTAQATEVQPVLAYLQAELSENEYFDKHDLENNLRCNKDTFLMSSATLSQIDMRKYNADFIQEVRQASEEDPDWQERKTELDRLQLEGKPFPQHWQIIEGLLYYKNRLFIPNKEELMTVIAKGCHDSQVAGHFGQEKTVEIATRDFHWKGLTNWINDYVRSCDECQHNRSPRHAKFGLLQPLQIPFAAWTSISTDFITQLPESQGKTQIMVVVDRFTKWHTSSE